jgi:hypothetical protein
VGLRIVFYLPSWLLSQICYMSESKSETDRLQSVPWSDTFPYRSNKGVNHVLGYLLVFSLYSI